MKEFCTPPVIRVFLSSTFADMDKERSYFNEVIAPKISRLCSERGVSFFSVDLRWGITKEEQISGRVLPICLNEIDKCRPYFIGMIGNRYGSVLEVVPDNISQAIPWLLGREGCSITELEMLYAVLEHDRDNSATNSAFYIRTEKLSEELYGDLNSEDTVATSRLNELKKRIEEDDDILSTNYESIEEFGDLVMRDLTKWLDENFPDSADVSQIRRNWYNSEILRNYVDNADMTNFIYSYLNESHKPLLIYGAGARGKTTHLTAWQPLEGHKILINCAADDSFSYWPAIAREIINDINDIDSTCGYPDISIGASMMFQLMDFAFQSNDTNKQRRDSELYFVTDEERENFRVAFVKWVSKLKLKNKTTIVINDLNLLEDEKSKYLSWLPAVTQSNLNIICTTNDYEMVQTAEVLGWNVKEMPLFKTDGAQKLINEHLHSYGKNLSEAQFEKLMSSVVVNYPGQLRFVFTFLINHGRFDNLDTLIGKISTVGKIDDIYKYVYDELARDYSPREIKTLRSALGILGCCNISLSERECFELSGKMNSCTPVEWSHLCRFFEQFDIIKGDYWNVRSEEVRKFIVDELSKEELQTSHSLIADYFWGVLKTNNDNKSALQNIRGNTAYAKEVLFHYQCSEKWDKLIEALSDEKVVFYLSKLDWNCVKSACINLFLDSDCDVSDLLIRLVKQYRNDNGENKIVARKFAGLFKEMGFNVGIDKIYEIIGKKEIIYSDSEEDFSKQISKDFASAYNQMHEMKKAKNLRGVIKYADGLLAKQSSFEDIDVCQILFFKADAEEQLSLIDDAMKTTNDYYSMAIKTGILDEEVKALCMRGNVLFRCGKYEDAVLVQKKVARISLKEGKLRDYLSALNIIGMCNYRMENHQEAISIFDKIISYWQKLSNIYEAGIIIINRCNALYVSGDVSEALKSAEEFYERVSDDLSMRRMCVSLLGNMGTYSKDLKLYDQAEHYLLTAIEYSKSLGQESTLVNAYHTLAEVYTITDEFKKLVDLRKEQMDFLWDRCDYSSVMDVLDDTLSLLRRYKYISHANKLESLWKEKFYGISGGRGFFERKKSTITLDSVELDNLTEKAIIARSEGDKQREAQTYLELAKILQSSNKDEATEYLLRAAILFEKAGDADQYFACIESSIILQFEHGVKRNDNLLEKILECADNSAINKIVAIWERIGEMADATQNIQSQKMNGSLSEKEPRNIFELICELLTYLEISEKLVIDCLLDVSQQIVYSCTSDELIDIINKIPENHKTPISQCFGWAMKENFESDLTFIMGDYTSPFAVEKIEFYEKCMEFLNYTEDIDAAAISGNLALIFRRRGDAQKTIRCHSLSIEAYKKAGEKKDCLIEMMNTATAYREFKEYEKAIELLRQGLKEASESTEDRLRASIAGNLASLLAKYGTEDNITEILDCFAIEEKYFRSVGDYRGLTISLLNQVIYMHDKFKQDEWKPKLAELSVIVRKNGFKEFMPMLTKFEYLYSQNSDESKAVDETGVKEKIESLLAVNGNYLLSDIKPERGYYHVTCSPDGGSKTGVEQLHIYYDEKTPYSIQLGCLYQPGMYQKDTHSELQKYVYWSNSIDSYKLSYDESRRILHARANLSASTMEELKTMFGSFLKLWEVDKINAISLLLGMSELTVCKREKFKAINSDE